MVETERAPILPRFGPNERAYQDDAEREVATPFLFIFIWVFVLMLVGRRLSGIK